MNDIERLQTDKAAISQTASDYLHEIERLRADRDELFVALKQLVVDYEAVSDPTDADGQEVFARARAAITKVEKEKVT